MEQNALAIYNWEYDRKKLVSTGYQSYLGSYTERRTTGWFLRLNKTVNCELNIYCKKLEVILGAIVGVT